MQEILVFILFTVAALYLSYQTLYRPFLKRKRSGCVKGCDSCGAASGLNQGQGVAAK